MLLAAGDEAVEHSEGVTHRAVAEDGDLVDELFVRGVLLFLEDVFEVLGDVGGGDVAKRWQRDWMVAGTLCASVVQRMNLTCSGGSSMVLSSALNAAVESMWTSSMM
jgi:hypothetical protein